MRFVFVSFKLSDKHLEGYQRGVGTAVRLVSLAVLEKMDG